MHAPHRIRSVQRALIGSALIGKGSRISEFLSQTKFWRVAEGGKHQNFMDTKVPGKGDSQELVRESLIAISQCMPDAVKLSSESNGTNAVELKESDTTEKYRSKLISISYADIETSPAALENLEV
ncbi:hypothetical protein NE237_027471 [Protea cynaroides]|uniref:Uncharacterized protein n=1 Tax=Protea cynaroides TaxID=273540 RepID=A0A9Q0GNL9_9MAGN|nr:hypothetical protein NE237_027471 [Protea cynaroides]